LIGLNKLPVQLAPDTQMPQIEIYTIWSGASPMILELFNELFTKTFGLNLEPQTPFFSALNLLGEDRLQDLETLEPTIFV
ncbi:MAG: hypothetical protein PHO79_07005, partial [Desulfoplanes sp.]|nr:hypothetical protein [Desulfoplanes sp.]